MKHVTSFYLTLTVVLAASVQSARAADDVRVQTGLSQTALWVGSVVTYRVTLTCRAGVDVLPEDLAADKLPLNGLQVVGQQVARDVGRDGSTKYMVDYQLTTFEPGAETLAVGDWTVRFAAAPSARGGSAPAQELQIPGAVLAWRSALPAMPATLDLRGDRSVEFVPSWWKSSRVAGFTLIAASAATFAWLIVTRMTSARPRKSRRRVNRNAMRDLRTALAGLRDADVSTPAERLAAYASLEAALRRHVAETAAVPARALTPSEFRERMSGMPLAADELSRVLSDCERARYQPIDRLPDAAAFRATVEAADGLFAGR
jgi:hypothetical protein